VPPHVSQFLERSRPGCGRPLESLTGAAPVALQSGQGFIGVSRFMFPPAPDYLGLCPSIIRGPRSRSTAYSLKVKDATPVQSSAPHSQRKSSVSPSPAAQSKEAIRSFTSRAITRRSSPACGSTAASRGRFCQDWTGLQRLVRRLPSGVPLHAEAWAPLPVPRSFREGLWILVFAPSRDIRSACVLSREEVERPFGEKVVNLAQRADVAHVPRACPNFARPLRERC
jgi:hypothetical protein